MSDVRIEEFAPAKVNLSLHVVGKRADGYHLLDSLVVFADVGDRVSLRQADRSSLTLTGPFAGAVPATPDNLVLRAAALAGVEARITLDKYLPVGAGIGGGSADAAAVLRGLARLGGSPVPEALTLGADVPVCVASRPARMQGVGERLGPFGPLPDLPMVLIHPGVPVATGAVFSALASTGGRPMPETIPAWRDVRDAVAWLGAQRNDLEVAAIAVEPQIAMVRNALIARHDCLLARMSGSGSCVFGLFPDHASARAAAADIFAARPDWWVRATRTLAVNPQESRLTT